MLLALNDAYVTFTAWQRADRRVKHQAGTTLILIFSAPCAGPQQVGTLLLPLQELLLSIT